MIKLSKLFFSMLLAGSVLTFIGCSDDDGPAGALTITALTATGIDITTGEETTKDLNAASSATDVPPDATFNITFNKNVDESTVNGSAFTLSAEDAGAISTTATASGSTVTVTPDQEMVQGLIYTLSISNALKSEDGGLFEATTRTFTVAGRAPVDVPQEDNLVVYVPFDGEVTEEMGHEVLNDNVTFTEDRFGNFNGAGDFNGTTNYVGIEYGSDMSNASTTVSYWIKFPESAAYKEHIGTTDAGITQFVTFGIGGINGTFHEFTRFTCCDFDYDIDVLKYFTNHVNSGSASEIAGNTVEMKNEGNPGGNKIVEVDNINWLEGNTGKWMHIVTSWDASSRRKSFYINGVPSTVFELEPSAEYALDAAVIDTEGIDADETNNRNLYLGTGVPYWAQIEGNGVKPFRDGKEFAFKGQMDDFRMFSVALTDQEVMDLYNAERP